MPLHRYLKKLAFSTLLLLAAGASALVDAADVVDLPREGEINVTVVLSADLPRYREAYEAFRAGIDSDPDLRGRLNISLQTPDPDPAAWESSVSKASDDAAHLLLTFGTQATLAARTHVPRLPTIYCDVFAPLRLEVEKDPDSFKDNVTGISSRLPMTTLLKTFLQITPVQRMGVLFNSLEMGSVLQTDEIRSHSKKTGYELIAEDIRSGDDIDSALEGLSRARIDVLYLTESTVVGLQSSKIMAWHHERHTPVIGHVPGLAQKGAILSLECDPVEQGQVLARCVGGLARGDASRCRGSLKPERVEFLVNLTAAEEFGLTVPLQVLTGATRVIRVESGLSSTAEGKAGQ